MRTGFRFTPGLDACQTALSVARVTSPRWRAAFPRPCSGEGVGEVREGYCGCLFWGCFCTSPVGRHDSAVASGVTMTVCPHCWELNLHADRLCGRCGADMQLVLQESGGLRRTAAVQSPVPVGGRASLTLVQRLVVLTFVILLFLVQVIGAIYASASRPSPPFGPTPGPTPPGATPAGVGGGMD
jgi:hypothetical protein